MMALLALARPGDGDSDRPMLAWYLWTYLSSVLALAVFVVSMQAPAADSVRAPRAAVVSAGDEFV